MDRLDKLVKLGCIVCKLKFGVYSPPEIHHLRAGMGMGMRNDDDHAIPLCMYHHRLGGYGVAIHAGQKFFESNYGTEEELLEETNRLIHVQDHQDHTRTTGVDL